MSWRGRSVRVWAGGVGVLTWAPPPRFRAALSPSRFVFRRVGAVLATWRPSDELVRTVSGGMGWRRLRTHLGAHGPSVGCCSRWRGGGVREGGGKAMAFGWRGGEVREGGGKDGGGKEGIDVAMVA